jgi:hypothetical protein
MSINAGRPAIHLGGRMAGEPFKPPTKPGRYESNCYVCGKPFVADVTQEDIDEGNYRYEEYLGCVGCFDENGKPRMSLRN